ncbi:MAG TPA: hypothetical protein VFN57_05470 [Thermomicrobiaceae bacterium]|nr:hypothetical protein [Thermomicrobiaceae bacterium]
MGYCPRCGENSPYSDSVFHRAGRQPGCLRIPSGTRIVDLADKPDGATVTYGGSRFRIHRQDGETTLKLVD